MAVSTHPITSSGLLRRYFAPHRARVSLLFFLLMGSIALPLIGPEIGQRFIDGATTGAAASDLTRLAIAYIVIAVSEQFVGLGAAYTAETLGWWATNSLRTDLFRHVLGLDISWHRRTTPGQMIERVDGDVSALSNFFSVFVLDIVGSGLMLVGILVLAFRVDPRAALFMGIFSVISVAAMAWFRNRAVPYSLAAREAHASLFGFVEERLAGADDIRANGGGHFVMRGLASQLRNWGDAGVNEDRHGSLVWVSSMVLYVSSIGGSLALGAWLYTTGRATIGEVWLLYSYTMLLDRPLQSIAGQLKEFQRAGAGIARVRELSAEASSLVDGDIDLIDGGVSLGFEGVDFSYGESDNVLEDLNLIIVPGEVVGLLGRTGSGKTSLTRLALRLYDPERGRVLLNGVDARQIRNASLRARVGVVTQDVLLVEGTIRDNVTLFNREISDERILEVFATLGLLDWYARQPTGLDTAIDSGGEGLSAGEAQLLAFARVFLRDPGLVLLDEATSRLDPVTESLLTRAVDKLLVGRTAIVIAHRLATVARADRIVILDNGRVVEDGRRVDLAADPNSMFSRLLRKGIEEVLA